MRNLSAGILFHRPAIPTIITEEWEDDAMTIRRGALRAAALAVPLALAACAGANVPADRAVEAQRSLVGLSKGMLLSCAGVPERQATADGREFFTYANSRIVTYPGAPIGYYGRPYWPYGWGWPGAYDDVRSYTCEATFTLRDGKVERLVYGGSSSLGECYGVVAGCLAQSAPADQAAPPK